MDQIIFKLEVNLHQKIHGVMTGPYLTMETLNTVDTEVFTKRKLLSIISSFYDPMGIISAYLVIFKIMMRETTALPDLGWDDPLPEEMQEDWKKAIKMLVSRDEVVFDRGTKPTNAMGRPELIGYWDGSLLAYAALLYIRWLLKTDPPSWKATLLCAKVRVTPISGLTAPRTELNGAVVCGRLIDTAIPSLPEKPCRVTMIGDSQCTISALESVTAILGPYFANRILELESTRNGWGVLNTDSEMIETPLRTILANNDTIMVDPVYHTAGELNIADMATRGKAEIKDVGYGSIWQSGPSYLREKRESWPVSRDFLKRACNPAAAGKTSAVWPGRGIRTASPHLNQAENLPQPSSAAQPEPQALAINLIPKEELRNKFYTFVNHFSSFKSFSSLKRIMNYSDSLVKVSGIMARYIIASRCKDKRSIYDELTVLDYERAAYMMLVVAMEETVEMLTTQDLSGLAVYWDGCVCWTKGRMGLAMKALLGPEKLAVLSPKSRLARLFMIMAHEEDHRRNAGDTLFRSRKFAWIVRGRNLAQSVVKKCEFCKVHQQKTLEQQMGDLPKEKFDVPCKPFTHLCVDLAGPYMVKAMNNARSKLKVWPVLFNCLNTGAVDIRLAYKQGTDAFLTAWNTFRAIRGDPDTVYSDRGSNLKKAATFVEEEDPEKWGWDEISKSSAKKGTVWRFTPPGCQFRDGLAESRVKMMKKSLVHLHSGGELNYAEFECVLAKAASVINDRPLGIRVHNKTEGDLVPVTPNLLLMAKTATSAKDNNLSEEGPSRLVKNQKRMEEVVGAWWNEWYSQVFSSLVPYNKWKKEKPNLEVGDVCLVKYDHKVGKADYRICRVEEVEMDAKGLVRTVIVGMRPRDSREKSLPYKSKKLKSLKLAIQRLILICPAKEVKELLDENEDEITGHATTVFIAAKPDWNKLCESDDRAEYLEDDDAGDVGVPDGVRPAVPDVQLLQAPPLYALPAYRECRPGTCYESNCGLVKEPVLNPLNIQANVPRDCLFENDEAMIEVQNEVDATVTTLCVHKDFDVDTEQS